MFGCSHGVLLNTSENGVFRFIDILKISAFKMSDAAEKNYFFYAVMPSSAERKTFSLIFVSTKQKLKLSQGCEAPAEGTDAPHLYMLATRSCRWRHRTFLSQSVASAFEMVSA